MNVNYEYYRLFYYVCKYHSITRAANVLRMSQPNVTRALNRLEELQAGESELAGITALESGALTISASETALNVFLLDKLREFHRRTPACGCALPTIPPRRPSVRWGAVWWIFV